MTATIDGATREVVLIPALRPEVRTGLQQVTEALWQRCLDKAASLAYVIAAARKLGEEDLEIRTNGLVTALVERGKEVFGH